MKNILTSKILSLASGRVNACVPVCISHFTMPCIQDNISTTIVLPVYSATFNVFPATFSNLISFPPIFPGGIVSIRGNLKKLAREDSPCKLPTYRKLNFAGETRRKIKFVGVVR